MGFEVYPVILRTREQGQLEYFSSPTLNLDYVLAYAKVNNKYVLIDGTDKQAPYYILPQYCINGLGRICKKDTTNWVKLTNNIKYQKQSLYVLQLDESDFNLKGKVNHIYKNYAAYEFRKKYNRFETHNKYLRSLTDSIDGLIIDYDTLINLNDVYKPVKEKADIVIQNQAFMSNNLVYLNLLPDRLKENPFKQEERKYPVDFLYPRETQGTLIITVPENYKLVTLPESAKISLQNNAGTFTYIIQQKGNNIMLKYSLNIEKAVFLQNEYKTLKSFYEQVVAKFAEPVVFKVL